MAREKSVSISVSEFWLRLKPYFKVTRKFKPLPLGTVCLISCGGKDNIKAIITKYQYPGYVYKNLNPWVLRYEFTDYYNKNHGYINEHTCIKKILVNNKFIDYDLEQHYYIEGPKYTRTGENKKRKRDKK